MASQLIGTTETGWFNPGVNPPPPDIPAPPAAASGNGPILTGLVGVTTHRLRR